LKFRWALTIAAFPLLCGAIVFAAGALAVESALRPPRLTVAQICPCVEHVRCRDAEVAAPDGTRLRGWYFESDAPNGGSVILLHGVGDTREGVVALGTVFLRAGYSVLTPDLRGHGQSGGILTYGAREGQDVHAWADWMPRQTHVARIYGFGASLGASELLAALDREPRFRAVIAESAYSSFPGIAYERMHRLIPNGLKWVTMPFVDSGMLWVRIHYGVDLRDASATEAVRRTRVPVLLIHGLADGRTSPDNSRALAAANPRVTQLWMIPAAGHANGWGSAGKEFELRVLRWFDSR
jgi:uncharacterized protein